MTDAWRPEKGEVIDGRFPLLEYLGSSENAAAVFRTEWDGATDKKAAIKIIPVTLCNPETELSRWQVAQGLSHPNLLRIFCSGRVRVRDTDMVFAVMEFADEDLSQILPQRPLTADEVRQMLPPILDALEHLHSKRIAHGRLKPKNVRAIGEQLKLSTDGIIPFNEATPNGDVDISLLGALLVEALTQKPPTVPATGEMTVPSSLPVPFLEIARHCLSHDPQQRWAIADVRAALQGKKIPAKPSPSVAANNTAPKKISLSKWHFAVPAMIIAIIVVVMIVHPRKLNHPESPSSSSMTTQTEAPATANGATGSSNQPSPGTSVEDESAQQANDHGIVHQVIPNPSPGARRTIQGHIKVRVRVHVDSSGKVSDAEFVTRGPSQYFARLAMDAAQQWEFAPAKSDQPRRWVLTFSFGRGGTKAYASEQRR